MRFLAMLVFVSIGVCAAVIRFALPSEPAHSAGHIEDFSWQTLEYVPLQSGLAVFLVREGDAIFALEAASTRSRCRIRWIEEIQLYRDPCCGAS